MSSFLDWLGEDPDTGEQPIRSLAIYDSREGRDVNVSPDQIYENRTSRKLAWQKGYEPVLFSLTDPLTESFVEIQPEKHGDGPNGPYTIPEQAEMTFKVKFIDPESPNYEKEWYWFKSNQFRLVLDPDSQYAKSDLKKRKNFSLLMCSFLQMADQDVSQYGGRTDDETFRQILDDFMATIGSFDGQEIWMNYQVGWYESSKTNDWELSEKPVRFGLGE